MSYQEKRAIVSLISGILISVIYSAVMIQRYPQVSSYAPEVFQYWGSFFLILIPVTIVAKIVVYILFSIIHTVTTREEEPSVTDERDKLIELKSTRNSLYVFTFGFLLAMVALVAGTPPAGMFIIIMTAGVVSEIVQSFPSSISIGGESKLGKFLIRNNIRRLRFDHDEMTQKDLADKVGVTRQTIVAIEKENYSPSLELAFRIAITFNVPLESVFFVEEQKS